MIILNLCDIIKPYLKVCFNMERDFILWLVGYMEGLDGTECTKPYFNTIKGKIDTMFVSSVTYEELKLRMEWEMLDKKSPN